VRILWTERAKDDLKGIFEYIAFDSTFYARRYVKSIKARTTILKNNSYAGRKLVGLEENFPMLRELVYRNHRIIYKINAD
jgi:plasmid stabilization system protein ParE